MHWRPPKQRGARTHESDAGRERGLSKGRGAYDSEGTGGEAGGAGGERGPVRRVDREALPERQDLGEQGSLLRVLARALLVELLASTRSDAREGLALGLAQRMQF